MLTLIPVSLAQANEFVRQHHRHHKPVAGHKFSIGCAENGRLCAVAIVGRPVSRYFKIMGAVSRVLDGKERLEVLHGIMHPDGERFNFDWKWLAAGGLSTKDFIAPSSFAFKNMISSRRSSKTGETSRHRKERHEYG